MKRSLLKPALGERIERLGVERLVLVQPVVRVAPTGRNGVPSAWAKW